MNKNFIIKYVLLILLMTLTCFIAYKVIAKVNEDSDINNVNKDEQTTYEEKLNPKVSVNYDENYELKKYYNENNLDKKIVDFSNCLHSYVSADNLDDNIKNVTSELERYYNEDDNNFAFYYLDLNTGFSIGYNEKQPIFGASVMKAPFIIYLYKQASLGKINLDDELVYTSNFYSGGSGILQNQAVGGTYSVRKLCYYAIVESDNIAYKMLASKYGIGNARDFWNELGVNTIYKNDVLFSSISAIDGGNIMKYLYDFSLEDEVFGKEIMNVFTTALYNFIPKDGLVMAHKSGWASTSIHDMAIKFDDNPYVLIVFTRRGEMEFQSVFDFTSEKIGLIHKYFWDSNINYCINEFKN